nr:unnamed protein product [Callosobruchus chinensis]
MAYRKQIINCNRCSFPSENFICSELPFCKGGSTRGREGEFVKDLLSLSKTLIMNPTETPGISTEHHSAKDTNSGWKFNHSVPSYPNLECTGSRLKHQVASEDGFVDDVSETDQQNSKDNKYN